MFFSEKTVLENAAAFLKLRAGVDIRSKCKLKATPLPSVERLSGGGELQPRRRCVHSTENVPKTMRLIRKTVFCTHAFHILLHVASVFYKTATSVKI